MSPPTRNPAYPVRSGSGGLVVGQRLVLLFPVYPHPSQHPVEIHLVAVKLEPIHANELRLPSLGVF